MKNIFWIAGESSGDLHAANVIRRMRESGIQAEHIGIGGPRMQAQGLVPLFPFERFAVMGFAEVVKHLRFFLRVRQAIHRRFQENEPDLVILVDYPGLNLRIAKMADDLSIPVLYYICPQFWAWKHGRVYQLKDYTRHVACILPFEKDLLDIHRINSTYVGHPIAEEITTVTTREEFALKYGLDPTRQWIGFLPGSREMELSRMMPAYIDAIRRLDPTRYEFLISKASSFTYRFFYDMIQNHNLHHAFVIGDDTYDLMKHCDALAVTSGTATLEAAYIGTPLVICYKTSRVSYEIGRRLVRIKRIGLPNIVLEEDLLPELIQDEADGATIAARLEKLLVPATAKRIRTRLSALHDLLGEKSASAEVSRIAGRILQHGDMNPRHRI